MKPRVVYILEWGTGADTVRQTQTSQAEALNAIVPGKPDRVIVATRNNALHEVRAGVWGSGLRVQAEEALRNMRASINDRAQERWG